MAPAGSGTCLPVFFHTHPMHHVRQLKQGLTNNAPFAGVVKRTGQLEAALAASQADVQNISHLLVQQKHQNSATKASIKTATEQHKKLTRRHASLKKAFGCSDKQKAVQLKQLLSTLVVMSDSMQHANSNIVSKMQLLRSELGKLQDQLAALHRHTDSPQIKAADWEAAEVAGDGIGIKQPFKQVRAGQDAGRTSMCCVLQYCLTWLACLLADALAYLLTNSLA